MKNLRVAIFGGVLTGLVVLAVSGLMAQTRVAPLADVRVAPHMMVFDGQGGQLGVRVRDLDAEGLKGAAGAPSGVAIDGVDDQSPAAKAGLREGDLVIDVDGERVRSARQFSRLIRETPEGKSVKLGIVRGGQRQSIDVTPETRTFNFDFDHNAFNDRLNRDIMRDIEPRLREIEPRLRELEPWVREFGPRMREFRYDAPFGFDFDMLPGMPSRTRLGVQLNPLSPQLAEYFGTPEGGALVASVTKDSAAEKAGLKAGDVITSINGDTVRSTDDLINELRDASGEVTIGIVRDKKGSTLKATIEPRPTPRRMARPI